MNSGRIEALLGCLSNENAGCLTALCPQRRRGRRFGGSARSRSATCASIRSHGEYVPATEVLAQGTPQTSWSRAEETSIEKNHINACEIKGKIRAFKTGTYGVGRGRGRLWQTPRCVRRELSPLPPGHTADYVPASRDSRGGHVPALRPGGSIEVASGSGPLQTRGAIFPVDNGRDSEHLSQALLWGRDELLLGAAAETRGIFLHSNRLHLHCSRKSHTGSEQEDNRS